jgi:hypothetical protein
MIVMNGVCGGCASSATSMQCLMLCGCYAAVPHATVGGVFIVSALLCGGCWQVLCWGRCHTRMLLVMCTDGCNISVPVVYARGALPVNRLSLRVLLQSASKADMAAMPCMHGCCRLLVATGYCVYGCSAWAALMISFLCTNSCCLRRE